MVVVIYHRRATSPVAGNNKTSTRSTPPIRRMSVPRGIDPQRETYPLFRFFAFLEAMDAGWETEKFFAVGSRLSSLASVDTDGGRMRGARDPLGHHASRAGRGGRRVNPKPDAKSRSPLGSKRFSK